MAKLIPAETSGQVTGYFFDCPGCSGGHFVTIRPFKADNGASWEFNGDVDKPTFNPSILSRVDRPDGGKSMICHSFVKDGKIQFLNDCTHVLAGQTVDIPDAD